MGRDYKGKKNPFYGKKHSEESLRKMRGRIVSEEAKRNMRGRIVSAKTKEKLRLAQLGKKMSKEAKKNMSKAQKGRKHSEESKKKIGEAQKGEKHHMYGKKHTKETSKKISLSGIGRKHSEESKSKMSEAQKGEKNTMFGKTGKENPFYGKKHSEEFKKMIKEVRMHTKVPKKDSKPEKFMQRLLTSIGIEFDHHKAILGQPDVFIKPNLCVFVDGDYWHGNPTKYSANSVLHPANISKKRKQVTAKDKWIQDEKITNTLKERGYNVLRFWVSELYNDPEKCLQKIIKAIK